MLSNARDGPVQEPGRGGRKAQLQHAALLRDQMETLVNSVAEVDPLAREANKNGVARATPWTQRCARRTRPVSI